MVSINVSSKTKIRFAELKAKEIGRQKVGLSEDQFVQILLDKYEGKK